MREKKATNYKFFKKKKQIIPLYSSSENTQVQKDKKNLISNYFFIIVFLHLYNYFSFSLSVA